MEGRGDAVVAEGGGERLNESVGADVRIRSRSNELRTFMPHVLKRAIASTQSTYSILPVPRGMGIGTAPHGT